MEWLVIVGTCLCVGSAVLCLLVAGRVRQMAGEAEMAAEDADSDAQACLGVSGSITSFAESEQSMVSELRKEMQQLVGVMTAAVERCDEAQASLSVCQEWGKVCHEKAETAVSMAELVKVEVAKLTTMIDQLNKVRQDNPPFVSITYGESGEPEKVEVPGYDVVTTLIQKSSSGCSAIWPDHTSAGTPFQFVPAQANTATTALHPNDVSVVINPVITERSE